MVFSNAVDATQQGVQYLSTTGVWSGLDAGAATQVLTSNGTGVAPSFQPASGGGSSVAIGTLIYYADADASSPTDYLEANGQIVLQATYPTLFSRVGLIGGQGLLWTGQTSGTSSAITSLTFGNGLYIFGTGGGGISTSTDSITWSSRTSGSASTINSLTYGTVYLASVASGITGNIQILNSTDGTTWATGYSPTVVSFNAIAYGNSTYVGVNQGVYGSTSTNGITWSTQVPSITGAGTFVGTPAMVKGTNYIAIQNPGNAATNSGLYSTDAVTWYTVNNLGGKNCVAFGNSTYVAAGVGGVLASSTDGITWTSRTSGTSSNINTLIFGSGIFIYAGAGGTLATSTDGITWSSRTSGSSSSITSLAFANGLAQKYVWTDTNSRIFSSTDGITWTSRSTTTLIRTITYGTNYLGAGSSSSSVTSTDGITWTAKATVVDGDQCTTFGAGLYVVACASNVLKTSTDGTAWTARTSNLPGSSIIRGLLFDGTQFIIAGSQANTNPQGVSTSTDGITWTARQALTATTVMSALVFGNGIFVSAGTGGTLQTSTDGISWTTRTSGTSSAITALAYANNLYVFATNAGGISSSTDAITWTTRTSGTTSNLASATANTNTLGQDVYLVGGAGGLVLSSTDAITWNQAITNTTSNFTVLTSSTTTAVGGLPASPFITTSPLAYGYDPATQFQIPTDAQLGITLEGITNFKRKLFIKAL